MSAIVPDRRTPMGHPTYSLQCELANFEGILTDEQKLRFKTICTAPNAASVIEFVAQLDANSNTKRRCVAPRLCTFLEAIQQFSGVVDTFISSNPDIAALVWGSAKMALVTIANIASYFEKVTGLIMRVGKMCPTYQQFGQLYPSCAGLQHALSNFYAVIIRLCIKIIQVSRRTVFKQTISSMVTPFESEFRTLLDEIDQATKEIYLQILLASEQADAQTRNLLEYESQENSAFRPLAMSIFRKNLKKDEEAKQWRLEKQERERAKLRLAIRETLSKINHISSWRQAIRPRVPGTAEWLQDEDHFRQWRDSKSSGILWCSGTMGMGKTVLMANIIAKFHMTKDIQDVVSYHFCRADNEASLLAKNIVGSIARQILDEKIDKCETEELMALYAACKDLEAAETNPNDMVKFLIPRLESSKNYYIIIDGLDECSPDEVREVTVCVRFLCKERTNGLKVIYSSWPALETILFPTTRPQFRISIDQEKLGLDMKTYIAETLDHCLRDQKLQLGDPTLILTISQALYNGSNGMFLWTRLLIEELCMLDCDEKILDALKNLPRGLAEIFDRKLQRIQKAPGSKNALRILETCGVTKRPLNIPEIQELLALSPEQKAFDIRKLPSDMKRTIKDCYGLIYVDEEDDSVHYVHHSVKQHLFDGLSCNASLIHFDNCQANLNIGFLCMVYLDLADFKRQLTKAKGGLKTPIRPFQLGTQSIYRSNKVASQIAQRILASSRKSQFKHLSAHDIVRMAENIMADQKFSDSSTELRDRGFQFLDYAKIWWIDHLSNLDPDANTTTWRLFCRFIETDDTPAKKPWEKYGACDENSVASDTLEWTLMNGHCALLEYFQRRDSEALTEEIKLLMLENAAANDWKRFSNLILSKNVSVRTRNAALLSASANGRVQMARKLCQAGAEVNSNTRNQTPLQAAAMGGHVALVDLLLDAGASVNTPLGESGQTALQAAARGGHYEVAHALLGAKADVNAPPATKNGRTALQAAAEGGHLELAEKLLIAGANVNQAPAKDNGRTALQAAASHHIEVVRLFLAEGADVNTPASRSGQTAIQAAARGGNIEIAKELLSAGADANAPAAPENGMTAIQEASAAGDIGMIRLLLDANADINAPSSRGGRTAIQAASANDNTEVVQFLIAEKAEINAPPAPYGGRTAIQSAAQNGNMKIVRLLLAANADVNALPASRGGRTALQAAAEGGHAELVQFLLHEKGVLDTPPALDNGRSALQAAAEGNHYAVVDMLIKADSNIYEPPCLENGRTALQAAAEQGHLEIVKLLLGAAGYDLTRLTLNSSRSARITKANEYTARPLIDAPACSRNGRTALQGAAQGGHAEIVNILLAAKPMVNAAPAAYGGRTALQAAAEAGNCDIVEALILARADINSPPASYGGRTALQAAASGGHLKVVKMLLAAKADVNGPPAQTDGITALQAAAEGGHSEVIKALQLMSPSS